MQNSEEKSPSPWRNAWIRLKRNRMAMFGIAYLLFMTVFSLIGPLFSPYEMDLPDYSLGPTPPSAQHWCGTDDAGRDQLTRIMHGGRISLAVGLLATSVALLIGVSYGAVSGFLGGKIDVFMMRVVDILYAMPFIIFVILLVAVFGRNFLLLFLAIGAVEWLTMARIVRGQVLALKQMEYIDAARTLGRSSFGIITSHLIPNAIGPVIVYVTLTIPSVMLLEAFLSFLGLGVQAPLASWGSLIQRGAEQMEVYPWLLIFPGLALCLTLFSLNFLGDGLRDALDPRMVNEKRA